MVTRAAPNPTNKSATANKAKTAPFPLAGLADDATMGAALIAGFSGLTFIAFSTLRAANLDSFCGLLFTAAGRMITVFSASASGAFFSAAPNSDLATANTSG